MIFPSQSQSVSRQTSVAPSTSTSNEAQLADLSSVTMTPVQPASPPSAGPAALSRAETREQILTAWVNEAPHEQDRPQVAEMIRAFSPSLDSELYFEGLDISGLPECLPDGLVALVWMNCPRLTTLPTLVPASLVKLYLQNCPALTELKPYPQLRELSFLDCSSLKTLGELPCALELLEVYRCPMCTTLPTVLPATLRQLVLNADTEIVLPENLLAQTGLQVSGYRFKSIALGWLRRAGLDEGICQQKMAALTNRAVEEGYPQFISLLNRLYEEPVTEVDAKAVVEVIEAVIADDKACRWIFAESERADHDCHARPLLILNTVGSLAKVSLMAKENGDDPRCWIDACQSLVKERLLDEIVPQVQQRNAASSLPSWAQHEMVPFQRELRQRLADELGLLFRDASQSSWTLSSEDLKFAADYVKNAMSDAKWVVEGLISLPVWETYALERLATDPRYEAITAASEEALAQLEESASSGAMNSGAYTKAMETLMADRQQAITGLLRQDAAFWLGVELA